MNPGTRTTSCHGLSKTFFPIRNRDLVLLGSNKPETGERKKKSFHIFRFGSSCSASNLTSFSGASLDRLGYLAVLFIMTLNLAEYDVLVFDIGKTDVVVC